MKNQIYYGDNLHVLRCYIKDETVDLCYIDPPFNSKRNYNQIYNNIGKEDAAQAFIDTWTWDDNANIGLAEIQSNYNGVFTEQSIDLIAGLEKVLKKGALLAYLVSMTLRIAEIHRVLKPTGSFYLHCDPTASHYLKLVLDAIFCSRGGDFKNEIIWCYSIGGKNKRHFGRKHDVIFFYTKSKNDTHIFNEIGASIPRKLNTHMKVGKDEDGREYQEKVDKKSGKVYRYYIDEGKIAEDYWIDIESLNREAKERLGYPTQKPEALLERIIKASSNEGDIILDAYCGCGTTIAVAQKLKRQWIGIDITYQSISLILKRLEDQDTGALENLVISGVPKDVESAVALANKKDDRTRKEFEKWFVLTYSKNRAIINEKKGGDGGIDGVAYIPESTTENSKALFSVKSNEKLSPTVIRDLFGTVEREKAACGILLTLYPMPNLVKESKKYGIYRNGFTGQEYPKIQVICAQEMFDGQFMELPNVHQVLKKAEQHAEQPDLL
ncbi:DNA modification methylase [Beggiatoa alba B18LD]|uniref:Methyltransferase n=1 Tax=Beggiatoa alba B18LD TaxID=395493 RepID=I3CHW8_9GAMM|nr:site-specific DNA-methyltransferase [Beggiatoa alba]EIJ43211.1 DNA modification methylase [Beggiatoa alba B18LD]